MNRAVEVAKYVINKCNELGRPISNLQLQKILYYIQGIFLGVTGNGVFNEEIEAWQYGPVVPEVYYKFNVYASSEITKKYDVDLEFEEEEQSIIDMIIEEKSKLSAWQLVSDTHNEMPWLDTYKGNNKVIDNRLIADYFKGAING
jgi:uncharacterized phage-associated protein